mgnify:CR=1 FL=1
MSEIPEVLTIKDGKLLAKGGLRKYLRAWQEAQEISDGASVNIMTHQAFVFAVGIYSAMRCALCRATEAEERLWRNNIGAVCEKCVEACRPADASPEVEPEEVKV